MVFTAGPTALVLIEDNLPTDLHELNNIYVFDREQLAQKIRQTVPGSDGEIIAEFLRVIGVPGWQFADLVEDDVQKLSKHDPAITECLLRLQGKSPNERKTTIIRLYPNLAGRIRRRSSLLRLHQKDIALYLNSSFSPIPTPSPVPCAPLPSPKPDHDSVDVILSPCSSLPSPQDHLSLQQHTALSSPLGLGLGSGVLTGESTASSVYMSANTSQTSFHTAPSSSERQIEDDNDGDDPGIVSDFYSELPYPSPSPSPSQSRSPSPSPSSATFNPYHHPLDHPHHFSQRSPRSVSYDGLTTSDSDSGSEIFDSEDDASRSDMDDEDEDDDNRSRGSGTTAETNSLLTPLQVVPNLTSDLEPLALSLRIHGEPEHEHDRQHEHSSEEDHRRSEAMPVRVLIDEIGIVGVGDGFKKSSTPKLEHGYGHGDYHHHHHHPPTLHPLEFSFSNNSVPSLLSELSSVSPHFCPTPLTADSEESVGARGFPPGLVGLGSGTVKARRTMSMSMSTSFVSERERASVVAAVVKDEADAGTANARMLVSPERVHDRTRYPSHRLRVTSSLASASAPMEGLGNGTRRTLWQPQQEAVATTASVPVIPPPPAVESGTTGFSTISRMTREQGSDVSSVVSSTVAGGDGTVTPRATQTQTQTQIRDGRVATNRVVLNRNQNQNPGLRRGAAMSGTSDSSSSGDPLRVVKSWFSW